MSNRSRIAFRFLLYPILCIVVYFAIIFLAATSVAVFVGENYLDHEGKIYLIEGIFGILIFSGWLLFRRAVNKPNPPVSAGRPLDWMYTCLAALAMLGVAVIYFYVVTHIHVSSVENALEDYNELMEVGSVSQLDLYLNVFATCLLVPVLEEIIFRGLMMGEMLQQKRPVLAIVFSSLFFGVMHGQVIQIGYAILAGMILGTVYYLTKNLLMSIMAHVIFNTLGSGIYLLFDVSDKADTILNIIQVAALLPFAGITVYMALKKRKNLSGNKDDNVTEEVLSGGQV